MARTPIHPGEILGDELEEMGISSAELSRTLRVPPNRISQIVAGKRAMTADTAATPMRIPSVVRTPRTLLAQICASARLTLW